MIRKKQSRLKIVAIYLALVLATAAALVWAMPGAVACAFIDQTSLTRWGDNKFSESPDTAAHDRYAALLSQARSRIEATFGDSTSRPHIVFFDSVQPFPFYKPNQYASTQFFGTKACIFIGPEGQNVDVVSHELVHTDIFTVLGPLNRTLHMPAWLDEGLAMQVDHRTRYDLEKPSALDLSSVGSWNSYREFFKVEHDDELANRYALSKARVEKWVEVVGTDTVYAKLKSMVSGGMTEESRNAGLPEN